MIESLDDTGKLLQEHTKLEVYKNYEQILQRLRNEIKVRKLRVGFIVNEHQKWAYTLLYKEFEKNPHFQPAIFICPIVPNPQYPMKFTASYQELKNFFKDSGMRVISAYNEEEKKYLDLRKFELDIVFYQQPWCIHKIHTFQYLSHRTLTCYVPYCIYTLKSSCNYLNFFHPFLWKYFVESQDYVNDYEKVFNASNCVAVGISKLDNWRNININRGEKIWNYTSKKRVIYAPHHSFVEGHRMATFHKNGRFILDFAQKHSEISWIFKPHPRFKDNVLNYNIMKETEIEAYYEAWEKIGKVYNSGDYYDLFATSDALITDCISFLTEYFPSKKPVLYLRSMDQRSPFTSLTQRIVDRYYNIRNSNEFMNVFQDVILEEYDPQKKRRIEALNWILQGKEKSVAENIVNYLESQLLSK